MELYEAAGNWLISFLNTEFAIYLFLPCIIFFIVILIMAIIKFTF